MDKKIVKLHEPNLLNKWYYTVEDEGVIGVSFLNGKRRNAESGVVASVVRNPPVLFVFSAVIAASLVYAFSIFVSISATAMSFIIFTLFLLFVAGGFEYSLNHYGKNKSESVDKISIKQPLSYTYNKIEVTRKIVALLNYLKDNGKSDSELSLLSAVIALSKYDSNSENYIKAIDRIQLMFKNKTKLLDDINWTYWNRVYPLYSSGDCKSTISSWEFNGDDKRGPVAIEEKNAFLTKVSKLSGEFPNAKNFKIVAENYDKLSVIDQSSFRVICEELDNSSERLIEARRSGNEELVAKLSPVFENLLSKSVSVVDRIKGNLDEAIVDELRISDAFLSDKFHM